MPRIDDKTEFVCLSTKEFENCEYQYKGHIFFKPKNAMWFSLPESSDGMTCGWHRFLVERAPDLISKFCKEDGTTNVISAKLKDIIIVKPNEIMSVFEPVKHEMEMKWESSEKEGRDKLLEEVKKKFNMPDAKGVILDVDDGLESIFKLFYPELFANNNFNPYAFPTISNIAQKFQEYGPFYYLNPHNSQVWENQLHEYKKFTKLITECLCGSDNLEEGKLNPIDVRMLNPILMKLYHCSDKNIDASRMYPHIKSLPYINLKKYSSKESVMHILEHVEASNEEKEKLLSLYDESKNIRDVFENEIFFSLMKNELLKDFSEFVDKVRQNNILIDDLTIFTEESWPQRASYELSGMEFLKLYSEEKIKGEVSSVEDRMNRISYNITSYFSGMINKSYIDCGLELPSLAIFDTNCLDVISQKEQVLFSKEQLIEGIEQNVESFQGLVESKYTTKDEKNPNKNDSNEIDF